MRRCPVLASASNSAVTTTLHKDGTVTYHFTSDVLQQTAGSLPTVEKEKDVSISTDEESSPASGHSLYKDMHARVSAAVADLDLALLSLDQYGYGSELNIDALRTAATEAASKKGQKSRIGKQGAEYVPEEELGPLIGADGTHIPKAALLKFQESQSQHTGHENIDSSTAESTDSEIHHQSESAAEAEAESTDQHESLRRLLRAENMQEADALHVLQLFSNSCSSGNLGGALYLVEAAVKARRDDIVRRYTLLSI